MERQFSFICNLEIFWDLTWPYSHGFKEAPITNNPKNSTLSIYFVDADEAIVFSPRH